MRSVDRDFKSLCGVMIVVRLICVGAALSLMAFLAGTGLEMRNSLVIAGLLFAVFPISVIWWLVYKSDRLLRQLVYAQLAADLVLVTGIVYCSGGALSHFTLLYFITILVASIFLSMRGALAAATAASVLYIFAALFEHAVGSRGGTVIAKETAWAYMVLNLGLEVASFYFMAILSGYLSEKIGIFGARLTKTARELQRVRTDTHSIIESMSSGFVIVDQDLTVTEFNKSASRMLGVRTADAIGRKAREVIAPVSGELYQKIVNALQDGVCEGRGEVGATRSDGCEVPLGISISLLDGDDSQTGGAVVIFQDLTDVKKMADRMRQADRLVVLGEMSAAIAHEIRTPLAAISGAAEMLRDSLGVQGDNRRLFELVVKESDRLKGIIDHYLEFARSRPYNIKETLLNSVLAEVICLVRNHPAFNAGISINVEAPGLVKASVDEETIKQVFYNLAINAVEALPSGGTLKVRLDGPQSSQGIDNQYAVVTFEDNGVGIEPSDLKQVFEPFFTRKRAGTGLGLAIASRIVQEHGGKIDIRSTKGLGTTVKVRLPLSRSVHTRIYWENDASHVLAETQQQGGVI